MRVALPRDRRDVLRQVGSAAVLMATRPLWAQGPAARSAPIVAAASDLKFALDDVVAAFSAQTGQPIRVVYGSSGLLAMQIRQGAPFELFLSADEAFVNDLAVAGLLRDAGLVYAIGQIALAVPRASMIQLDSGLRGLRAAVSAGLVKRLAIANPDHAPYGRRAREVLIALQVWAALKGRLVLGENVSQAAQFAVSGSSDGGLVAQSLTMVPGFSERARSVVVSDRLHSPLIQRMALTRLATTPVEGLYRFLQSDRARTIMTRYGFGQTSR